MKKLPLIFFAASVVSGCAKLPVESVQLNDAIMTEGERMHNLNIMMVNELFNDKKEKVAEFIEKEYTPRIIQNFTAMIRPEDVTLANLPDILDALIPKITQRRDSMIQTVDDQRVKLVTQMNVEYQDYYDASIALHNLLQSVTEVDRQRASLNDLITQLGGNKIDLNKVEHSVDDFITKGGSTGSIQGAISDFDNNITNIIQKKY